MFKMLRQKLRSMYSLRKLMSVLITIAMIITVVITNALSREDAKEQIEELFDAQMLQTAKVLELFYVNQFTQTKVEQLALQPIKLHVHATDVETFAEQSTALNLMYEHKLSFQLLNSMGDLLVYSDSSGDKPLTSFTQGYELRNIDDVSWHVFSYFSQAHKVWIVTAQSEDVRKELLEKMMSNAWTVPLIVTPIVLLILLLITYSLFKPLKALEASLLSRTPQDLSSLHIDLPSELVPVQDAINDYLSRISQAMQRERRFSADAAHELKTPLAIVKLHHDGLQEVLNEVPESLAPQLHDAHIHLNAIDQGVERMSHMVEQLLLLSRVDALNALNLAPTRVGELIETSINQLITIITDYEWQINIADDLTVNVDPFYMALVCKNLIENACKYSPKESIICIDAAEVNGQIVLRFSDNGKGMTDTQILRAKERFYRVDENANQGAGLGLSICQHIVSLHCGTIHLHSNLPNGLTVVVSLPIAPKTIGRA
ncbi:MULTISPECIES: ATP-binding protein [Pseudomonadati]|uniref:histidine kinase n=1 Tax=Shewanella aestuarii TaxID=1028752 RepID=A0ABT0L2P5_9GAMM|nr:ATP-binding protein [Shewanella aestuarii]MCL1118002.1 ATP-binding protein [Shewanella aestuarii]GGN79424.1 two-component sensor histidine kinase [Shewanella aestuarii]